MRSTSSPTSPIFAATCDETGEYIVTNVTFDVQAQRRDNRGAREVDAALFRHRRSGRHQRRRQEGQPGRPALRGRPVSRQLDRRRDLAGAALGRDPAGGHPPPDHPRAPRRRSRAAIDPMADPAVRAAVDRAQFRGARRLRARRGAAALQRHALELLTSRRRPTASRAAPSSAASAADGPAGERGVRSRPPPKEQPPRNLSGKRTARPGHSGKRPPSPRQGGPPKG